MPGPGRAVLAGVGTFSLIVAAGASGARADRLHPVASSHAAPFVPASLFRGARPSSTWRIENGRRRLMTFPTQIQHVVVVVMENRTVDNLLAAYYNQAFPTGGTFGQALNLYNPSQPAPNPTLTPIALGTAPPSANYVSFDPSHAHGGVGDNGFAMNGGFEEEFAGNWNGETFSCTNGKNGACAGATAYAYVPASDTAPYRFLITQWGFADNVFQPNEGPSFVAHQYLLAAQSGGKPGATTAPYAEAENPDVPSTPTPTPAAGSPVAPQAIDGRARPHTGGCDVPGATEHTLDMSKPYLQDENRNPTPFPCEEYSNTIVDEIAASQGGNAVADWQFIASNEKSIWAAPIGVKHLYVAYEKAKASGTLASASFAVDPYAVNFAANLHSSKPTRPFASLTFITPCDDASDHPVLSGNSDGPAWLAWLVDQIGTSPYWNNTTILVTWDDWGGWFDHVPTGHPLPNTYTVAYPQLMNSDANEWGFRVPFLAISPYLKSRAYVSNPADSVPSRSFSVMMQYTEATFGLGSMFADDFYQNLGTNGMPTDYLHDMFDFSRSSPLPYTPYNGSYTPPNTGTCKS